MNKKKSKRPGSPPKRTPTEAKLAATPTPAAGLRRIWLFRLGALTLVPLLFLGTVELGLRLGGYGYPTGFLLKREINGHPVYVENGKFGWRFFPRAVARSPAPLVMPARKSTNTFRIFLLGESAALGDPEPAYGFGRYLEVLLRDRFPDTRFEVVCLAMTAINSHAIRCIARECARREGDLWVIYMGNNEMEGPFGAGATFGPRAPNLALIRASLAMKTTKLGQWLDALVDRFGGRAAANRSWTGMKMFLDSQSRHNDPARRRVYSHFEKNLEDILATAQSAGTPVVLSTVASNLKDCGPFASLNSTNVPDEMKVVWDRHFKAGQASETVGQFALALDQYAQAARIDPDPADLHFRMGRVHLGLNNFDQAQRSFERARDFDALPFRSDSRINEIIRRLAAGSRVRLLDFEKVLAENSTNSIPGVEQFFEHVHLNFHGNYLLARAVAEQVAALLPKPIGKPAKDGWAASEECDRRLALTDWNRFAVLQAVVQRISDAPFTNQLDHSIRYEKYFDQLVTLKTRMTLENADAARQV
ncbi:MAG TPA: tetratricopeptide repeat protein, partial [Verrucomicrobiae bacterium]|nr:tetratricopeptide repeat protein [Verrucomicrobiae bacterium]